ncbi:hypothetical protein [Streptomyces sp. MB09-01]|uniref:hypothetical protein n=1 Tax=Streptomyces sp. MB09-01 TaxID=3028666 RepID=UPI003A5BB208
MMGRAPNRSLAGLMAEAGWGNGQLARAVNRTGAEAGMELSYSASTVTYWLKGTMPREGVPQVITEALSRRIGRPITCAEAGFPGITADTVGDLSDLVRGDMDPSRRRVLSAGLYSAAMMVPVYSDLGDRLESANQDAKAGAPSGSARARSRRSSG